MKAIVLSSGGVDSTVCIAMAIEKYGKNNVSSISVFYGQKHKKEILAAQKIAEYYGVVHQEIDLFNIFKFSDSTLVNTSNNPVLEQSCEEELKNGSIISSYVPFRNGVIISAATALIMSTLKNDNAVIYIGVHSSDYAYADCSKEFIAAINKAVYEGTYRKIQIEVPLLNKTKTEVIKMGLKFKVPFEYTWTCYKGEEKPCLKCASCLDRLKAFEANGTKDPALMED